MVTNQSCYTITIRIEGLNETGLIHKIIEAIEGAEGMIGAIDLVEPGVESWLRDFHVHCGSSGHEHKIMEAIRELDNIHIVAIADETFRMHIGGKLNVVSKLPLTSRPVLSMAYTPGVGRVSSYVAEDPSRAWHLTIKGHTVAVVSDGSAVLGLGNLGPEGALPVMEGKAQLFKEFGGVDAFPLCIDEHDPDRIVEFCRQVAPTFGGINLEDISAPRCFYIEERLKELVDIPVFHDDQHGTAVVVLAAATNAFRLIGKSFNDLKVVVLGVGAAGVACTKILQAAGVENIIGVDRQGIIYEGRETNGNQMKAWYSRNTNPDKIRGGVKEALVGADLFLGLSGPGLVDPEWISTMGRDPVVFAMSNPVPEVLPEDIYGRAAIIATGRSDYPNQINNVLCFPGIFRGAMDAHATDINEEMKLAAAQAIAGCCNHGKLNVDYIVPSVFDKRVAKEVAKDVAQAAHNSGVAKRRKKLSHLVPAM